MNDTFEDLRVQYSTFHADNISREPRKKFVQTKECMKTRVGEIEVTEWRERILTVIEEAGERALLDALVEWAQENCAWLHNQTAIERYAIELHASRIFDDRAWVGYVDFNRKYRAVVLRESELITIVPDCCGMSGQVTKEQLEVHGDGVFCPHCGRFTMYKTE